MKEDEELRKVLDSFNILSNELEGEKQRISSDTSIVAKSTEYKKIYEAKIKKLVASPHFSTFGPLPSPFIDSAKKYISDAKDARTKPDREGFRLGIEKDGKLIGCLAHHFTVFQLGKRPGAVLPTGFPSETTGQSGIFIDPDYRQGGKYGIPPLIHEVSTLGAALLEKIYPPELKKTPICLTAHPLNIDSLAIIRERMTGIKEHGVGIHPSFGKRIFFTISYGNFIESIHLLTSKLLTSKTRNTHITVKNILFEY
jgi:hypothetical protein